jgi:hypothetical protein
MKNYCAIAALLVLWSVAANAEENSATKTDANAQGVATIGTGTFSCVKFTQFDASPNNSAQMNLIVQWAWGFISAYNLRAAFSATYQESEAPSPVSPPDAASTLTFIRKFCEANPKSNLTTATLYLIGAGGGIVTSSVNLPKS